MSTQLKIALIANADPRIDGTWTNAVWAGLSKLGTIEHSNPNMVLPEDFKKFDMIVCAGARGKVKDVIEFHKNNIPVIVYDLGYIKRHEYSQFCLNGLNNIETNPCDNSRLLKLDFYVHDYTTETGTEERHVFFVQKVGDAQHGLNYVQTHLMLLKWRHELLEKGISDDAIYYKPHPLCDHQEYEGINKFFGSDFDSIKKAYTYNSTSCVELLRTRVPVVILDKSSIYYQFSDRTDISTQELVKFFSKLSYSQWNKEEVATGDVFTRLFRKYYKMDEPIPIYTPSDAIQKAQTVINFLEEELYIHASCLPPEKAPVPTATKILESHKQAEAAIEEAIDQFSDQTFKFLSKAYAINKHEEDILLPTEEIVVTPEQKENIESAETVQAFTEKARGLKFFELKKVVKSLTGVTPKNKEHADSLIASHFNKI